jgi:hypothetical protein
MAMPGIVYNLERAWPAETSVTGLFLLLLLFALDLNDFYPLVAPALGTDVVGQA